MVQLVAWRPKIANLKFANMIALTRLDRLEDTGGRQIPTGSLVKAVLSGPARDVVVLLRKDFSDGEPRLVAYASPSWGNRDEALQSARQRLPAYMLPGALVDVETWPRTSSGKIDRNRLELPPRDILDSSLPVEAPQNDTEIMVVRAMALVLHKEKATIGTKHDFFTELGGTSLSALRLLTEIARTFPDAGLALGDIYENATPASLAVRLQAEQCQRKLPLIEPAPEASTTSVVSWNCEQLFVACSHGSSSSSAYNMPFACWFAGVDGERLEEALRALVRRHRMLRACFRQSHGALVAEYSDTAQSNVCYQRCCSEHEALALAEADAQRPFEIQESVFRALLVVCDSGRILLLINLHHIAGDGVSCGVLQRELSALYRQEALPRMMLEYDDFAKWQRLVLEGNLLEGQFEFWQTQLRSGALPILEVPTDRPRPMQQSFAGDIIGMHGSVFNFLSVTFVT